MRTAIEERMSRRKFSKEPLSKQEVEKIKAAINSLNEASGLGIMLVEDGSSAFQKLRKTYGLFSNVRSVILMKGKKELNHLKEMVGYYGEDLILTITDMGLGTCWVGGTFDKDEFTIEHNEELICVIVVGKVEAPNMGEKLLHSAIHRKVKSLEQRITSDQALPQWAFDGMQAVLLAPTAKNTQKPMFKYENGVLSAHIADDYALDLIDLGIAKKHFDIEAHGTFEFGNGGIFHLK